MYPTIVIIIENPVRLKAIIDAEASIQKAQLEEFKNLNNQETLLNDVEHMRWVHLLPQFTAAQKKKMMESRREQMDRRGRMDTPSKNTHHAKANKT